MEREIKKLRSIKRRNFFSAISKSAAGLFILNLFPVKLFASDKSKIENKKTQSSIKVNIHPLAVKRTKRG